MKLRALIVAIACTLAVFSLDAQRYNIGIRAGINYSQILGPNEEGMNESSSFNNGIHFGLTYSYKFTERFGLKTEILYTAVGSRDSINGPSYYIFGITDANPTVAKEGYAERYFERNNSYINIPIHAYFKPIPKLELFGGLYAAVLINPRTRGTLRFDDLSDETKFGFIQTLDYNYYTDRDVQDDRYRAKTNTVITTQLDDRFYFLPQVAGAYYQFAEKDGGLFRWFDAGLSGGFQYYINKSFFAGVRADYGLIDITRRQMDVNFRELNETTYTFREDFDRNFSMQFSVGFKF